MPSEDLIVGLDIGTTKICSIIGQVNQNRMIEIIGVGRTPSKGLRRGVVVNIEQTVKSVLSSGRLPSNRTRFAAKRLT